MPRSQTSQSRRNQMRASHGKQQERMMAFKKIDRGRRHHLMRHANSRVHLLQLGQQLHQNGVAAQTSNLYLGLVIERRQHFPRVSKGAGLLHALDAVALEVNVASVLLKDVDHLVVLGVAVDAVDDGKGKLALGNVLTEALICRVLVRLQVGIVVADLEVQAQNVQQLGEAPLLVGAIQLHQAHCKCEQPSGLPHDHLLVLVLSRAGDRVTPVDVHALTAVQLNELGGENLHGAWIAHGRHSFETLEVHVVGAVDGLRNAIHAVGHRDAAAQLRVVLNVIDQQAGVVENLGDVLDDLQLVLGNVQPLVESFDQPQPHLLARHLHDVVVRLTQNLLHALALLLGLWGVVCHGGYPLSRWSYLVVECTARDRSQMTTN
eukprot:m.79357 g.79357  ORF g.79357 m.79357 type:complete len:376 (+) comp14789_c0_seq2:118-1245(+)